ncbi:putative transmembrane protein [Mycobacterium xenopi 4042]|uniref:Putative transmembrane protein n=1 Tax=Mycobacterium xenopi 4042 TaxID=1299334 RepID=X7ZUU6_MYCXE|nr:putative transmembrane protein [Mycobacterium xenopi 4042]
MPIYLMRSSRFTALELAQTLRYFPDLVVVLALLAAVGFCAPNRASSRWLDASAARTAVTASVVTLFVASSLYSTATFLRSWRDNPAQPYLQHARRSLADARTASSAPLLDQEVDPLVLQRVAWPENLASHIFALLRDRPEFASTTTQLRILDSSGGWSVHGWPGCGRSCRDRCRNADTLPSRTDRRGWCSTGRCCPRTGPPRSTTWPTATARSCCR